MKETGSIKYMHRLIMIVFVVTTTTEVESN